MLHACVQRFDVTGGRGNILGSERGLNITIACGRQLACEDRMLVEFTGLKRI
jgi:hypothetical protein